MLRFVSHSVEETMQFAQDWAKENVKSGDIICLRGDLGAGKTHFVKGLVKALGGNEDEVSSPTFTLIHEYRKTHPPVFHFDAYRLKSEKEAIDIGIEEYIYGDGVSCIEWPERIESLLPDSRIEISLNPIGNTNREIIVTSFEK